VLVGAGARVDSGVARPVGVVEIVMRHGHLPVGQLGDDPGAEGRR
jgi:hypothetical protein